MIKRPVLIITISYILGILGGLYLEINMVPLVTCITIFFIIFIYLVLKKLIKLDNEINEKDNEYKKHKKNKESKENKEHKEDNKYNEDKQIENIANKFNFKISVFFIIICVIIIFFSYILLKYKESKYKNLYSNIQEAHIVGTIIEEKEDSDYYYNYIVNIKYIKVDNGWLNNKYANTKVILKVKKDKNTNILDNKNNIKNELKYGDCIKFYANIEKPSLRRNYKGFNYSQYLKTKGIYAICKTSKSNIYVISENDCGVINMWINKLQKLLKTNLSNILLQDNFGVANAILLGDTNYIEQTKKEVFSNASLSHILAISGMHVNFIILGMSNILKRFNKRRSKYVFIVFLIFFAKLTGASPSVVRAVIMGILAIFAQLLYRKADTKNCISLSCLIILIYNPYNILNIGFQLSFLGTLGIVLFNEKINNLLINVVNKFSLKKRKINNKTRIYKTKIINIISVSISANTLIFPILIYTYNTFSITFLISNLLVTPILGIILISGYGTLILSIFSMKLSKIFSFFLQFFINIFNKMANFLSEFTFLRFQIVTPNIITIVGIYVIIFYLFMFYKKKHNKYILKFTIVFFIVVIVLQSIKYCTNTLKIHFIDVGQGDSTLIITPTNKTVLIDGGGSEVGNYDIGKNIVVPYLLDRKVKTIDYMIFSHFDSDHCDGLFSVIENLNVKNVIISKQGKQSENYKKFNRLVNEKNINIIIVEAGDRINVDYNTSIDILWPTNKFITDNVLNNNSIVCKMNFEETKILFTGDIEEVAEIEILKKYSNEMLNSNILKVAHHGSKTSSTLEFIQAVNPSVALIGVGENNNFGHPNLNVINRIVDNGCKVYRTDINGEVVLKVNTKGRVDVSTMIK